MEDTQTIASLPSEVKAVLFSDADTEINEAIRGDFYLTNEQFKFVVKVVLDIILQRTPVLELTQRLSRIPDASAVDMTALALRIATDKLWPLQEYLKNVDVLINRLGGRVPAPISLSNAGAVKGAVAAQADLVHGAAKEILQKYRAYPDLYLTQKPIRDSDDRLKAPTLNNWLQDYLHTAGAEGTGSLKRSKYLTKSANALTLNDPEKQNLLNFLVSYEDGVPMYWRVAEEQYLLIEAEMPKDEKKAQTQQQSSRQMSDLLAHYASIQGKYRSLFEDKKKGLELEINGNTKKIADIVWDALGLGDTVRCLSALDLLIDHHWLLETLKTDHRFQGIMSRNLGVKYGIEAKNTWNGDLTTSVMLAIFWKLILVEKLNLEETVGSILADYFRKKLEQKISPIYLDLQSSSFRFREITYKDRAFSFVS